VGRIGRDQVEDYAVRQGLSLPEAESRLRPNLGYEPSEDETNVRVVSASSAT